MALTENKKVQSIRPDLAIKKVVPADAGTYYAGQVVMVGAASNTGKAVSGSVEPATQVIGMVTKQQTVAAGESLEVEAGLFVGAFGIASGSGFTHNEVNKLAWTADGVTIYDAQSGATNAQVCGRFQGFTTQANGQVCSVFSIGTVLSGTTV